MTLAQRYGRHALRVVMTIAAVAGGVGVTYPGGWAQLAADVRQHDKLRKSHEVGAECSRLLDVELEVSRSRYLLQATQVDLLARGDQSLDETATVFAQLYPGDSLVMTGLRERYPGATDDEIRAALAYHRACERPELDERLIERWAADFAKRFGRPIPSPIVYSGLTGQPVPLAAPPALPQVRARMN